MLAIAGVIVVVLWPPGLLDNIIIREFWGYVQLSFFPYNPSLVGDHIFEVAPRWAVLYWFSHLDLPIFITSASILVIAFWRALRRGQVSSKHVYLTTFLGFFLTVALTAPLAGARYLLQFIGVLCVATGALFDDALDHKPLLIRSASAAVVIAAGLNLLLLSRYTPFPATDGYRVFLQENQERLRENTRALVYGLPILRLYAKEYDTSIAWYAIQADFTTSVDNPLPHDIKYVLIPAFYDYMPADQPMRRIVANQWKLIWSFKSKHAWELRLYENPQLTGP